MLGTKKAKNLKNETIEQVRADLERTLPPVFARTEVGKLTGGILNPRTCANLDALGQGPPSLSVGRKKAYLKEGFIAWFIGRIS